jgi:hypothetical protein
MHGIGGPYEQIGSGRQHQDTGPSRQRFIEGNEDPEFLLHTIGGAQGEIEPFIARLNSFTHSPINHGRGPRHIRAY